MSAPAIRATKVVPVMSIATGAAKRLALEIIGWTVLVLGILALVLPGPGLLMTFAGLAILSTQYAWARRWVEPVRVRALKGATEGVETLPRIILSTIGALALAAVATLWFIDPRPPNWWMLPTEWWLLGGAGVGTTFTISAVVALSLLGYSVRRFYRKPEAVAEVDEMVREHKAKVAARRANKKARKAAERAAQERSESTTAPVRHTDSAMSRDESTVSRNGSGSSPHDPT